MGGESDPKNDELADLLEERDELEDELADVGEQIDAVESGRVEISNPTIRSRTISVRKLRTMPTISKKIVMAATTSDAIRRGNSEPWLMGTNGD